MGVNSPYPYNISQELEGRSPTCVFKLVFGSKYFIFKGLRIAKTVEGLSMQIHKELNNPKEDSVLFKVVAYVRKTRIKVMTVDLIKETDDTVDLLLTEYEALQGAKNDPNCLNTRFINYEYYPNWIPQIAINEFNKRLQGVKPTDTDKNLKRFLFRLIDGDEAIEQIIKYVKEHYKPGNRYDNSLKQPKV